MKGGHALKVAIKQAIGFRGVKQVRIQGGPARGVQMTLDFSGHTPIYLGMYEWELHRFFRRHVPAARLLFDVGGYMGYDALMFATLNSGRVITFEPSQQQADVLQANLELNPGQRERITICRMAIAPTDGDGVMTIDSASSAFGPPDFIKIDIDGGELDALQGAVRTLREHRPHLVVETHSRELEELCGNLLVECGYRPIIKHNRSIWREQRGGIPHNRWLLAEGRTSEAQDSPAEPLAAART